jgi:hypothetical protein
MVGSRASLCLLSLLLALLFITPAVSAEWSGDAEVVTGSVHVNASEVLRVAVTNDQSVPLEVTSVTVTINWHGTPTLYGVFEGSSPVPPGETRVFAGPSTLMPAVPLGTYTCFASVQARGPDGAVIEHRYDRTIAVIDYDFSFLGIPEEVIVPVLLTAVMLSATLVVVVVQRASGRPGQVSRRK